MTPMQTEWKAAYGWQRRNYGFYCVHHDRRITEALRKVFVITRVRQAQMRSGKPACYPVTAMVRPYTGERKSRWVF